jgi:hypothetical protein
LIVFLTAVTAILAFLALRLALASPPAAVPTPGSRLTLRNGTIYLLKEPPQISGTRVIFTTMDGRMFSMDESEIATIGAVPKAPPVARHYDEEDSRQLGAIARQQRDARGKRAEVAPRAPARRKTPKPPRVSRTPRPHARPRPTPVAGRVDGTTSPG